MSDWNPKRKEIFFRFKLNICQFNTSKVHRLLIIELLRHPVVLYNKKNVSEICSGGKYRHRYRNFLGENGIPNFLIKN